MPNITELAPVVLWRHFQDLCGIPRLSRHEQAVIEHIRQIGEKLGLHSHIDESGNIVIRKPASAGLETRSTVILQSHLDMVPQKHLNVRHDFLMDPVEPFIDGDWVKARGTNLGADNGIGVAAALAILEADDIEHGPLEILFTVDQENGMIGAGKLRPGLLKGSVLLNLDSVGQGRLFVGCAGAIDVVIQHSYSSERLLEGFKTRRITVSGLKGGHSGLDAILQRANANKIMVRLLKSLTAAGVRVISFSGSGLRNAIPREAVAEIAVPSEKEKTVAHLLEEFIDTIQGELAEAEPDLRITDCDFPSRGGAMPLSDQYRWLNALHSSPDGIERMSMGVRGVMETSNNLAVIEITNGVIRVENMVRSLIDSARKDHADAIAGLYQVLGARVVMRGGYPGWKPKMDSKILSIMVKAHETLFGIKPDISVLHAGLECGLLGSTYPHLDMISFGPAVCFSHSPDERVHIPSVSMFWNLLKQTLKNIP